MKPWIKERYTIGKTFSYRIERVIIKEHMVIADEEVKLSLFCNPSFHDNFTIHIFSSGDIHLNYGNERSLNYAFFALDEEKDHLEVGLLEGGPDFKIRGIIEGFYGTPWSHSDRLDVIRFIDDYRMNAYFYAPKDDPYHRFLWRESYPEEDLSRLVELIDEANQKHIDFYFCISPGQDFIYTKDEEFEELFKKINQVMSYGVKHFSLLMDDIDYDLKGESKDRFQRPGVAHAYISNRLNRYLASKLDSYAFVMCPTEYWQNWDTEYRKDLREGLDTEIMVFWTGYNTVAEYIPNFDGNRAKEIFNHPLILWDNYPVNDMATDHLFMGPLVNRGNKLSESHVGMLSNPMIPWHLSKLPVITMADYMWDSHTYQPEESYREAVKDLGRNDISFEQALKIFADENRPSLIHYQPNITLEKWIQNKDFHTLDEYFKRVHDACQILKTSDIYPEFTEQALPWIERFERDFQAWVKIKKGQATPADFEYIENDPHVMGYQVLAKIAKKMNLYHGKIYKKERPNFWDNPKVKR
jgi:hyaluronoglucosaminidase